MIGQNGEITSFSDLSCHRAFFYFIGFSCNMLKIVMHVSLLIHVFLPCSYSAGLRCHLLNMCIARFLYIVPYALFLFAVWIHRSEGAEAEHSSCYKETGEWLVLSVGKSSMFLQLHFNEMLIEHSEAHRFLLFHCYSLSTERTKLHHLLLFIAAQSSTRMVCHILSTMEWHIFRPHLHSIPLAIQLQQQVNLLACTRVSIVLAQVWMQDVHTHTHCYSLILICSGQSSPLQVSTP